MRLSAEVLHANLEVDLLNRSWDEGVIYPSSSREQWAMSAIHRSLLKKFHNERMDSRRDLAALQLFLSCNDRCKAFTSIEPNNLVQEIAIGEFKRLLYNFFYEAPMSTALLTRPGISAGFRWGNGSNIGSRSTDFYTKSSNSRMSASNQLLVDLFRQDISITSKLWSDVEAYRSQLFGYEIVRGNRLSFVPKSRDISRTICTEPLLNMLYQQGIAAILERRLKRCFGINLSDQPQRNARLARIGSVNGRFGTIDLSSASDTISLSLIREVIPPDSRKWIELCRSPYTTLPSGEEIELHMVSSMGNGYTFPLQTTLFACLVAACYQVCGIPLYKPDDMTDGNFAVFGDDIIVDYRAYDLVVSCLEILGFSVNRNKSFNEGLFRESCGSDWFSGYNVRGVYISRLITSGDVYSAINRLNRWSAYHGIPLVNTVSYLRRGCRFIGVPYDEADDAGIKVPLSLARRAYGDPHGTWYYLAQCNLPLHASVPTLGPDNQLTRRQLKKIRKLLPDFEYLPDGLLLSQLAGYLRDGRLGLRLNRRKSVLRWHSSPGWDRWPQKTAEERSFGERWKALTELNLVS